MKIFISGATKGLGFYLAKEFLLRGDSVWGIGRSSIREDKLGGDFSNFKYLQCDTTIKEQVKDVFDTMIKEDFIPDIAIFCAGSATEDIVENGFMADRLKDNFNVNLYGVLYWVELMLPYFLQRKKGIFTGISSMSIFRENHKKRVGYSASKLALNKSFENLHLEYSNRGVRFLIFNLGRMREKKGIIGTSYYKAAKFIIKILKSDKNSNLVNIPFAQYLLTKTVQWVPEKLFVKYLRR